MLLKKLKYICLILFVVICFSVMFVNAREPLDDTININVKVKSQIPSTLQKNTISVGENKWIYYEDIPENAVITSAKYGAGSSWKDFKSTINDKLSTEGFQEGNKKKKWKKKLKKAAKKTTSIKKSGKTKLIQASNSVMGDPIVGTVKDLIVEYTTSTNTSNTDNPQTTTLNNLSLYDQNGNNFASGPFDNSNVNETNDYTNEQNWENLPISYLIDNNISAISNAGINVGNDNLELDEATISFSSSSNCVSNFPQSKTIQNTNIVNDTNTDFQFSNMYINDSCYAIAPSATSIN